MKNQSAKIEFLNSQCFHGEEILKITQKWMIKEKKFKIQIDFHTTPIRCTSIIEDDKRKNSKCKLIFILYQFGVNWWINIYLLNGKMIHIR